jgi:hypothetical protein
MSPHHWELTGVSGEVTVDPVSASGHEKIPVCGQLTPAVRSSEFPLRGQSDLPVTGVS